MKVLIPAILEIQFKYRRNLPPSLGLGTHQIIVAPDLDLHRSQRRHLHLTHFCTIHRHGSQPFRFTDPVRYTAEIAEVLGKTLTQNGAHVDVLAMQDVKDLSSYRAVVAGSAIRKSKWLPEAMQFIQDHRTEFVLKRFATFTFSITLAMSNTDPYR